MIIFPDPCFKSSPAAGLLHGCTRDIRRFVRSCRYTGNRTFRHTLIRRRSFRRIIIGENDAFNLSLPRNSPLPPAASSHLLSHPVRLSSRNLPKENRCQNPRSCWLLPPEYCRPPSDPPVFRCVTLRRQKCQNHNHRSCP